MADAKEKAEAAGDAETVSSRSFQVVQGDQEPGGKSHQLGRRGGEAEGFVVDGHLMLVSMV